MDRELLERLEKMEDRQHKNIESIAEMTEIFQQMKNIPRMSDVLRRITRLEERHQSTARLVYIGIGGILSFQILSVFYMLNRMAGG